MKWRINFKRSITFSMDKYTLVCALSWRTYGEFLEPSANITNAFKFIENVTLVRFDICLSDDSCLYYCSDVRSFIFVSSVLSLSISPSVSRWLCVYVWECRARHVVGAIITWWRFNKTVHWDHFESQLSYENVIKHMRTYPLTHIHHTISSISLTVRKEILHLIFPFELATHSSVRKYSNLIATIHVKYAPQWWWRDDQHFNNASTNLVGHTS